MTVILAFDSFKGCISSREAAEAASRGILRAAPYTNIHIAEMADGGEGMAHAMASIKKLEKVTVNVPGPEGIPMEASYRTDPAENTAYIDMSAAAGLYLVAPERRNPLHTSTFGFGQLMADAIGRGCRRIVAGLGGSSTNDAAFGALQALGAVFTDIHGKVIDRHITGKDLTQIASMNLSRLNEKIRGISFEAACDVDAPFSGDGGAVDVFAEQKGASEADKEILEAGMKNVERIIAETTSIDISRMKGAGAAGGCGGTLHAVVGAVMKRGVELVAEAVDLDALLAGADICITGEGRSDRQTLMWKTPYGVMKAAERHGVPTILMCGSVSDEKSLIDAGFTATVEINAGKPADESIEKTMLPSTTCARIAAAAEDIMSIYRLLPKKRSGTAQSVGEKDT